jgi:hypothetical protein
MRTQGGLIGWASMSDTSPAPPAALPIRVSCRCQSSRSVNLDKPLLAVLIASSLTVEVCLPFVHYWGGPKSCCLKRTQSPAPSAARGSTRRIDTICWVESPFSSKPTVPSTVS